MSAADSDQVLLPLRTAMLARDIDAAVDCFAPDGVLRSPFTDKLTVTGRDQIRTLISVLCEVFEELSYTDEARAGNHAFLASRARIAGQDVEIADHVRLRPDGAIEEFTVFFRPLPGAAAALRAIAGGLARRKSAARGAAVTALTSPLAAMTRAGDGVGAGLVRSAL